MKEKDSVMKTLESYNDVFADIVNVLMFGGKRLIRKNALSDAIPYSYYKVSKSRQAEKEDTKTSTQDEKSTTTHKIHGQERDVSKYWSHGKIRLCFIGFENQTSIEPLMPLRVMSYDAASYMQRFLEKDKVQCYPVVTLVLYFGTKRKWTNNLTLKDLFQVPPELEQFVNNYRINVVNLAWLSDEQIKLFKSDFREIAVYLRCKRTKELFRGSRRRLRHAFETLDLLRVISGGDKLFNDIEPKLIRMIQYNKKGGINMDDVLRRIMDEGHTEWFNRGVNDTTALFSKLYSLGRDADVKKATSDRAYLNKLMAEFQVTP